MEPGTGLCPTAVSNYVHTYSKKPSFGLWPPFKEVAGVEFVGAFTFLSSGLVSGQNLALGKPSLQSSTLWNYEPGLAVDDDPDSCSFTPRSTDQRWWQVHLGDAVTIQSVAVTISPGSYQHFTIFVIGWIRRPDT